MTLSVGNQGGAFAAEARGQESRLLDFFFFNLAPQCDFYYDGHRLTGASRMA
jgi:hypothetical protein